MDLRFSLREVKSFQDFIESGHVKDAPLEAAVGEEKNAHVDGKGTEALEVP